MRIGHVYYLNGFASPNGPTSEETERMLFITFGAEKEVLLQYKGEEYTFWVCNDEELRKFEAFSSQFGMLYSVFIKRLGGRAELVRSSHLNVFEAAAAEVPVRLVS
ncbi:MAG: hypothetical protein JWN50_136 [Parcubacteria group bacterium]|nr:hypothetical protein [Parcubacteria group bacterium]